MNKNNMSHPVFLGLISLLLLLCIFTALNIWPKNPQPASPEAAPSPLPSPAAMVGQIDDTTPENNDSQKCHIRLYQGQAAIYAGPLGGGGQLLRHLELPLQNLPPRWLAQLTNGGIEFANEEALLMALDNLDELAD